MTAETAFLSSSEGELVAISLPDGERRWERDAGVVADTGICGGRDAVVAVATNLTDANLAGIVAYERADGAVRWEHPIEGFDAYPSTPPVLADQAVFYVSNESSGVVALGDLALADDS